jgi:hypothetical protein
VLELPEGLFGEDQIRGLIEEWLVPRLVERLIGERLQGAQEA